jgi:hypothetical protein
MGYMGWGCGCGHRLSPIACCCCCCALRGAPRRFFYSQQLAVSSQQISGREDATTRRPAARDPRPATRATRATRDKRQPAAHLLSRAVIGSWAPQPLGPGRPRISTWPRPGCWVSRQSTAAGPLGPPGYPWGPLDMFWYMYLGGLEHIEAYVPTIGNECLHQRRNSARPVG